MGKEKKTDKEELKLVNDPLNPAPEINMPAAAYIEKFRDDGFPSKDPEMLAEEEKELYLDRFLRIMAARNIVDSVRGKKDRLVGTEVNSFEVDDCARIMKNDPTFQKFLQALKDDPKKMKAAISAAAKRPGHGGGLDDMFKAFVKNQAPSQLRNDLITERYLPTVKERIEILKKQSGLKKYDPALIAAEIIQLRNLAQADKGHKASLEKKIPARRRGDDLSKGSMTLAEDAETHAILGSKEVVDLIGDGHGGNMMEAARKKALASLDPEKQADQIGIFKANTVGTRMKEIEAESTLLRADLRTAISRKADTAELMKKSKLLIAEYMLLDKKSRDPKTDEIDGAALQNDVPWLSIEKIKQKGPESNDAFRSLFKDITPEDMCSQLGNISHSGQQGLRTSLADRQNGLLMKEYGLPADLMQQNRELDQTFSEFDDDLDDLDDAWDERPNGKEQEFLLK